MISVIIPVYNVACYLEECLDSVINQTYKDLEIILVDDGSTDGSDKICDRYKTLDARIQVLHKKNGGLADARNAGIKVATGKYIGFVDSDDYIHPRMYEMLYDACERNQAEIAICRFQSFENYIVEQCYEELSSKCFTRDEVLAAYINEDTGELINPSVCCKLFQKTCVEQVMFPVGKLCEDIIYTTKAFINVNQAVYLDAELYFYRQRAESIMNNSAALVRRIQDELEQYENRLLLIQKMNNLKLIQGCQYELYNRIFLRYCDITDNVLKDAKDALVLKSQLESRLKSLRKEAKQYYLKKQKQYTFSKRIKIWAGLLMPVLYRYTKQRIK